MKGGGNSIENETRNAFGKATNGSSCLNLFMNLANKLNLLPAYIEIKYMKHIHDISSNGCNYIFFNLNFYFEFLLYT